MSENRCVCCGGIIPEGQQVCPLCQKEADEKLYNAERTLKRKSRLFWLLDNWVIPLAVLALIIWVYLMIRTM